MSLDAAQIRAARALLDWTVEDLANATGLNKDSIKNVERGHSQPRVKTEATLREAFERAGVVFTEGSGVKRRNEIVRIFEGQEGIERFYGEIYATAQSATQEFLQFGLRYQDIGMFQTGESVKIYRAKMMSLKRIIFRCIVSEEEKLFPKANYATYRYWPSEKFLGVPFYVFGDSFAILSIHPEKIQAIVILDKNVAEEYRRQFAAMWSVAYE